jgi:endoglucanase
VKNAASIVAVVVTAAVLAGCGPGAQELSGVETKVSEEALSGPMPYRGVNLASADFGVNSDGTGSLPGTFGSTYTYPDPAYVSGYSAQYFVNKGMTTFRLPFRWERLQRTRGAAFDSAELTRLTTTVNRLTGMGAVVLLDPHNYARYGTALIGSSTVSNADFADFWSRLATQFKGNSRVLFGLMNEPYDLPTEQWVSAANAAIAAIRATGATNLILVPGNAWTGAHSWTQSWYGTPNSTALLAIKDPGNNVAFEVHQYLDSGYSGSSDTCVSTTVGPTVMAGFTQWLRANGKKGFLGEFAGGNNSTCLAALDTMLGYLDQNSDVYLGWTYWAGGPWWGSAWTSIEPTSTGQDKAQLAVLVKHLGGTATTPPPAPTPSCTDGVQNGTETGVDCGGSCAPCPTTTPTSTTPTSTTSTSTTSTCTSTTWEAETAYHSTGGAVTGGWDLWSNGYLETATASFPTAATLVVTARGSPASGVWPHMVVSVGSTTVGAVSVTSSTWATYSFPVAAGASGAIRVTFDNDAVTSTEDRNLFVDKIVSQCASTTTTTTSTTTTTPTPTGTCTGTTVEAETMFHSTGGAVTGGWDLWSNGYASAQVAFPAASAQLVVTARGTPASGIWPHMVVSVGGVTVGSATVASSSWAAYSFPFTSSAAGTKELRVTFDNDALTSTEDRNLFLDKVALTCP